MQRLHDYRKAKLQRKEDCILDKNIDMLFREG